MADADPQTAPQPGFTPVSQEELDFLGTDPIPASAYYDPDWYELERKAVFLRSWINIGHVCEVPTPGNFIHRQLEFASASLLIVKGKDGELRAFHNACTHRGTRLVREYRSVEHTVTVLADGYEWQGRPYRSLSAIARAITGTRWNGLIFFGVKRQGTA